MSSDPTLPVAPVIKIMSSGPLFEIGFRGGFVFGVGLEWAQLRGPELRPVTTRWAG